MVILDLIIKLVFYMSLNKFLILCLIILLLSGCSSEYNLFVSDNLFKDNIHFEYFKDESLPFSIDKPVYVFHNDLYTVYDKKIKNKRNLSILDFNYTYKPKDFVNANSFNYCFVEKNIIVDNNDYFEFNISKYNGCVLKNNFDIKIKTNNKVLEHNADSVNGNTYIWHVDTNNPDIFNLHMKIAKGVLVNNYSINYVLLIICSICLFLIISIFIFRYKFKYRNKI